MDPGKPGDDRMIPNFAIPGQSHTVDQDHMVFDRAVMSHMGIGHEETVITDGGDSFRHRPGMGRKVFPENIVIPDFQIRLLAFFHMDVLGTHTQRSKGVNHIIAADFGISVNTALPEQLGPGTDFYIRPHIAKGTDFHIICEDRTGFYNTAGMDFSHNKTIVSSGDRTGNTSSR
jgi:hypothetical protein